MIRPPADASLSPPALKAAIAALEAQRDLLGDVVIDAALAGLKAQFQVAQAAEPTQALRLVSILFLDVVGSTALARELDDPEETHAVMDGALARFTQIVQRHGGRVMQYAGDNLLAGFGADEVQEDDAERAVRCGLALLAEGGAVAAEVLAAHGLAGFDVRVGIHTGGVLLGGGVDAEGTIRGNAVNIAARMEQSAAPGTLLLSVDTFRLVQGRFDVQPGSTVAVKGLDTPVLSFVVERERPRSAQRRLRGVEGASAALVGRDDDLAQLRAAAERARSERRLQALTLLADAGLGKSRLLAECEAHVPDALVLPAQAQLQGLHQPYGVIRDLLFRRFDVQDSDALAQAQDKLAQGLAALFGDQAPEQTALLGQLIGLDYASSPFIAGILQDGRQLRARALHAWVETLRRFCARLPPQALLLVVLDDLHWADDGSLDAIAQLAKAGHDLPVLLLCAARPELLERRSDWGAAWPAHQLLTLQPLADTAQQALANALLQPLGDHSHAPALRELLMARTDGNPFYMEALLQMLIDQGVLVTSSTPWQLTPEGLQMRQVPTTLAGVLQARLDALGAPQRRALQQASVVGAVFWDEALASIDDGSTAELLALCRRALVLPHDDSAFRDAAEFAFRHHLLHEVTYGTVLKRDKRQQHLRAALWLESRSAGRHAEFAGLIAEHFERAGETERAAAHWAQAAEAASLRHADSVAMAHVERALALGGDKDPQSHFALLRVRANVASRMANLQAHRDAIQAVEALADAQGDDLMRLIAGQLRMYRQCLDGDFEEAHRLGVARLAAAGDRSPQEAAKTHNTLVMVCGRQGRYDDARAHAQTALSLARAAGDGYVEASVLNNLSVGYMVEFRVAEATAYAQQALASYQRIGSRYGAAIAMLNLALVDDRCGHYQRAHDQLLQLLALCEAIGHLQISAQAHCNMAGALVELDRAEEALIYAREGLRLGQTMGDRFIETTGHSAVVEAAYHLGRWPLLIESGRLAQAGHAGMGQQAESLAAAAAVACALHALGEQAAAQETIDAVMLSVAGRGGWTDTDGEAAGWAARALRRLQDPRAASTLAAAYHALTARAATLPEPGAGAQFLQAMRLRRETIAAYTQQAAAAG